MWPRFGGRHFQGRGGEKGGGGERQALEKWRVGKEEEEEGGIVVTPGGHPTEATGSRKEFRATRTPKRGKEIGSHRTTFLLSIFYTVQ